jgi:glutathionyl-hydroquinone reductase
MRINSFPYEAFIKLENDDFYEGRITVNLVNSGYNAEIDIVNKESKKIFKHVEILYNQETAEEALEMGVQKLASFLKPK